MDVQQMKYFLDVAETEHMTRSAERLHIAQPALSRSISHLESELGTRLFAREGRGIKLTEEGRLLQRRLSKALTEIDRAKEELAEANAERRRTIRVHIKAASLLAIEAISSWMKSNPNVHVELAQVGPVGLPADISIESAPSGESRERRMFAERIMLAVPVGTAFDESPVPLAALAGRPFISLDSSAGFRKTCDELCARWSFAPAISLESDNPDVVRQAIALGLGVGFWPERSWGVPGERVSLLPLAEEGFKRSVGVSLYGESECARSFYEHLVSLMGQAFS